MHTDGPSPRPYEPGLTVDEFGIPGRDDPGVRDADHAIATLLRRGLDAPDRRDRGAAAA
jgi:hypothetical protein